MGKAAAILGGIVRDPRVRTPVVLGAAFLAVLSLQRLVIWLTLRGRFADVPGADLLESFLVGLRFDVWTACVGVAPLVALLAAAWPRLMARRGYQYVVALYCAAAGAGLVFLCVADYYFFEEYNERLNHKALEYLAYPATYALLWHGYPVVWAFLATAALFAGLVWISRRVAFPRGFDSASVPRLVVWLVVIVPLLVLGIRGGWGPMAINNAPAYFSPSIILSQLTLDGPFTLREALVSRTFARQDLGRCIRLLPEEQALTLTRRLVVRPEDRLLDDPDNPLRRITDSGRPEADYNVVLVMMESVNWAYVSALGGEADLTPTLNALAEESVLMERCFAVGCRTSRAMAGIVCGFPDLPGISVTTRSEAEGNCLTLAQVLLQRGYETMFLYGGQPEWDHLQAFMRSNGFVHTFFEDDFQSRAFRTMVGWSDEDLFNEAHREFVALGDRPFFATLMTISFHYPFLVPPGRVAEVDKFGLQSPEFLCVRYADWALGEFLKQAREAEYFERTIFVFVADHRGPVLGRDHTPVGYRVPFLIYAPGILGSGGRRVGTVCSQTDVAPTIMSLLGGSYEHSFFGSSVLDRPADVGLALMQNGSDNAWLMAGNGDAVQIPFGGEPRLWRFAVPQQMTLAGVGDPGTAPRCAELYDQAAALLQTATAVFERGSYRLSDDK